MWESMNLIDIAGNPLIMPKEDQVLSFDIGSYLSLHKVTLDAKGRMNVPAEVQKVSQERVNAIRDTGLYPRAKFTEHTHELYVLAIPTTKEKKSSLLLTNIVDFHNSSLQASKRFSGDMLYLQQRLDSAGRLQFPKHVRDMFDIEEKASFHLVGRGLYLFAQKENKDAT